MQAAPAQEHQEVDLIRNEFGIFGSFSGSHKHGRAECVPVRKVCLSQSPWIKAD